MEIRIALVAIVDICEKKACREEVVGVTNTKTITIIFTYSLIINVYFMK